MVTAYHRCILKAGVLSQKRSALPPLKRYVILCAPLSVPDIQEVFAAVFKTDPATGLEVKTVPWLGNVACAAVRGTPLLIIMSSEHSTSSPTFIHFSDIRGMSDESQLRSACNFAVHIDVKPYDYRFAATSSTEYQEWNEAFGKAMSIMAERTMGDLRDGAHSPSIDAVFEFERLNKASQQPLVDEDDDDNTPLGHVGRTNTAVRATSPPSPPSPLSKPRQKTHVLPENVAPPSSSRTYVLGQDVPQSPVKASPVSATFDTADRPPSVRPSSSSTAKSSGTRNSSGSSNGRVPTQDVVPTNDTSDMEQ
ncbi:hypothetical protein SpCBS45565_g01695 [Spizellomyces sp. 'palustris']|nr:hypothetical protein SpCBS45565_g01695 [Spizellomyces sp. 'palustris']